MYARARVSDHECLRQAFTNHEGLLAGAGVCLILLLVCLPAVAEDDRARPSTDEGASLVPRAPENGGPRRWRTATNESLALHKAPSTDSPALKSVSAGELLDNFGCIETGIQVWCEVQPSMGGPRGYLPLRGLMPVTGTDGRVVTGIDDSRDRARRRDFDKEATIACLQARHREKERCQAQVARGGGGDSTVSVTFPNGFTRTLYFVNGQFWRGSSTMSGVGTDTEWQIVDDTLSIRVDDQRFEFPVRLLAEP